MASIPPNLESKSGATPPVLDLAPQFLTQVFNPFWASSPSEEKVFKGVVCPVKTRKKLKNGGSFVKAVD